jgi:hypothetical protein
LPKITAWSGLAKYAGIILGSPIFDGTGRCFIVPIGRFVARSNHVALSLRFVKIESLALAMTVAILLCSELFQYTRCHGQPFAYSS